jgi:hypothetical protein
MATVAGASGFAGSVDAIDVDPKGGGRRSATRCQGPLTAYPGRSVIPAGRPVLVHHGARGPELSTTRVILTPPTHRTKWAIDVLDALARPPEETIRIKSVVE